MSNYKTYRDFHLWVGLILLIPVSVIAVTGFLWNHEKSLGIKAEYHREKSDEKTELAETTPLLSSPGVWTEHASSIDEALAASQSQWGAPVEIERIELKQEPGYGLIVKVKASKESDVHPEEVVWSVADRTVISRDEKEAGTDWAKVVHDLHTGKFFSDKFGFIWSDSGAIALVLLGFTGVVLYTIPFLKKRNKKNKAVAPAAKVLASVGAGEPK